MADPKLRIKASGYGGSGYYNPFTQERVIGVTTALGVLEKPGIPQWVADNTAAYAIANVDRLMQRSDEQGYNMLRFYHSRAKEKDFDDPEVDIHNYHEGVLHDASELGTVTHEWLEAFYNDEFEPNIVREEQYQMIEKFLEWDAEHDVEVIQTEVSVFGSNYGGTADLFAYVDGVPTCLDFKTSRGVYTTAWGQLAALGAAHSMALEVPEKTATSRPYTATRNGVKDTTHWEEHPLPAFEQYAILHLRPDEIQSDGSLKPAFCNFRVVSQDKIDRAYDLFQATVQARHVLYDLKKMEKEGW